MSNSNNTKLNEWDSTSYDRYIKSISKYDVLTHEKEKLIAEKINCGDEKCREELIQGCLRFVITVAKRYAHLNIPFEDLINDGNFGLIKASKKYDPNKGVRFITFAFHHINGEIITSIHNNSSLVRIPKYLTQKKLQIEKELEVENGNETLNEKDIQLIEKLETIKSWDNYFPKYVELENEVSDLFNEEDLKTSIENNEIDLNTILEKAITILPEIERFVIELYFGINPENKRETFQSISEKMGLSKEGVRIIQIRALKKLKKFLKNFDLDNFMDR